MFDDEVHQDLALEPAGREQETYGHQVCDSSKQGLSLLSRVHLSSNYQAIALADNYMFLLPVG